PVDDDDELRQRFRRAARFRDGDDAAARRIERGEQRGEAGGIDVLHEMEARRAGPRPEALIGQRAQRLPAEARAADAEHQHVIEAAAELVGGPGERGEIVASRRQTQQRQAAVVAAAIERRQRRLGAGEHGVELTGGDAALSDGLGKASGNVLTIGHRTGSTFRQLPLGVTSCAPSSLSGEPTTTKDSLSGSNRRWATRLASSSVTLSISVLRRSR